MSGLLPPNPLSYEGQVVVPFINRKGPPTTANNKFSIPTVWVDTVGEDAYILVSVSLGVATWVPIGGVPGQVNTLTGNSGGAVSPTADNINVVGDGSTIEIVGDPGTSTLTASTTGAIATSYQTDSGTAVASGGVLTINGTNGITTSGSGSTVVIDLTNPVTVPHGGTGVVSNTAYSVLCGGTVSTNPIQSVASVGTSGQVLTSNGAGTLPTFQDNSAVSGFTSIAAQSFTTPGAFTYTPTAGMQYVIVELCGGGGGSGGISLGNATTAASAGGGAAAYAKFILTAAQVGVSLSGSVGSAGTAGAAGNNPGGNGGNTTLATSSSWTVSGGSLSSGVAGSNTMVTSNGGVGGTVTTGTGTVLLTVTGQNGGNSTASENVTIALPGSGGGSPLGSGGIGSVLLFANFPASSSAIAGSQYGGGASGCAGQYVGGGTSNIAGAAGASGIAIFTEFCS